ncbi:MAG: metallophosphoesterase [Kiritimatiellaeota bacterium]|nr:metallophosphoesterase [Kiritimatiellota bacterium]
MPLDKFRDGTQLDTAKSNGSGAKISIKVKIAVIADTHYAPGANILAPSRRGEIADILLLRAVHRINRLIHPDITLILGDIHDAGGTTEGMGQLGRMREIAALLESPWLIIPGNHDAPPEQFFSVFPRPAEMTDINNVRFVPFLDPEEPGYNARRTASDLMRMQKVRAGWHGPIVALQHVPIFPRGRANCPYNYVNAGDVVAAMRQNDVILAISGHYHEGVELISDDGMNFLSAPALCQPPFSFLEIDLVDKKVAVTRHDLRLPAKLYLWDMHVHTQFAYCSENMDIVRSIGLGSDFGLAGLTFTEHSGQLYFDNDTYWSNACLAGGITTAKKQDERMQAYLAALNNAGCLPLNTGLEADCCFDGSLLVRSSDINRVRYLLGSVHGLSAMRNPQPDIDAVCDEFLALTGRLVHAGIDILAHPFRVFARAAFKIPQSLYDPVVKLLRETGVAVEINFHTQTPDPEFYRRCLAAGVKLAFGSDAHNLYEIGEFAPHLALLSSCGFNGDLDEILLNPGHVPA